MILLPAGALARPWPERRTLSVRAAVVLSSLLMIFALAVQFFEAHAGANACLRVCVRPLMHGVLWALKMLACDVG